MQHRRPVDGVAAHNGQMRHTRAAPALLDERHARAVVVVGEALAITQPGIGGLDLVAVDNALMKHAILVADAVSVSGQCQGGQ